MSYLILVLLIGDRFYMQQLVELQKHTETFQRRNSEVRFVFVKNHLG